MKKFTNPEVEIVVLNQNDAITVSGGSATVTTPAIENLLPEIFIR